MENDSRHAIAHANESMQNNLSNNEPTIFAAYGLIGAARWYLDRGSGSRPADPRPAVGKR